MSGHHAVDLAAISKTEELAMATLLAGKQPTQLSRVLPSKSSVEVPQGPGTRSCAKVENLGQSALVTA